MKSNVFLWVPSVEFRESNRFVMVYYYFFMRNGKKKLNLVIDYPSYRLLLGIRRTRQ